MKPMLRYLVLLAAMVLINAAAVTANDDPITSEEIAAKSQAASPKWDAAIQEKYGLTAQQISDLRAKGLNNPQIAIVSQLSKSSGKPLADIVKMRQEEKMGWGRIAKDLGVPPGEIGRSVASMRKEIKEERHEERVEKREERHEERQEDRKERQQERKERRQERREDRKERKH